jgi:hypothetical protein
MKRKYLLKNPNILNLWEESWPHFHRALVELCWALSIWNQAALASLDFLFRQTFLVDPIENIQDFIGRLRYFLRYVWHEMTFEVEDLKPYEKAKR